MAYKTSKGNPSTPGKGTKTLAREKWLRENAAKVKAGNAALALSLKKG